jgi:hypothetical protein
MAIVNIIRFICSSFVLLIFSFVVFADDFNFTYKGNIGFEEVAAQSADPRDSAVMGFCS